jgi:hypothetical protein
MQFARFWALFSRYDGFSPLALKPIGREESQEEPNLVIRAFTLSPQELKRRTH